VRGRIQSMRYRLRTLLTWIAGLFPAWEWEHLRSRRFAAGNAMGMVGMLFAGIGGAEENHLTLAVGLIVATAGIAIGSIRYIP